MKSRSVSDTVSFYPVSSRINVINKFSLHAIEIGTVRKYFSNTGLSSRGTPKNLNDFVIKIEVPPIYKEEWGESTVLNLLTIFNLDLSRLCFILQLLRYD